MAPAFADGIAIGIICWCLLSVVVYAACIIWLLVRVDWRAAVDWTAIQNQYVHALSWCQEVLHAFQRNRDCLIDVAVHKLAQQRQSRVIKWVVFGLAPVHAIFLLLVIGSAAGILPLEHGKPLMGTHVAVFAIVPAAAARYALHESDPGKGFWFLAHIFGFGSLLLTLWSYENGSDMLCDRTMPFAIRVCFAFVVCDLRLTTLCNAVYSAFAIYAFHGFAAREESIAQYGLLNFVYQELGIAVAQVLLHGMLWWRLYTEARATIEAKTSANSIFGLKKVLRTHYDVVAELNDELAFTDDSKDLAGVLLYAPSRSLKGARITDLMDDDADKEAFSMHVLQPAQDSESQCSAIPHVFHMRDTCSNLLAMELWHTSFEDLDSRLRHLVAIKELANQDGPPSREREARETALMQLPKFDTDASGRRRQPRSSPAADRIRDDEQPRQGQLGQRGEVQPQVYGSSMRDGEDSDDSGSSAPSTASRPHRCLVEGFRRTSAHAQKASMLHMLTAWNVRLRPAGCCAYHDLTKEATSTAKSLARASCRQIDLDPALIFQCANCAILSPSSEVVNYDPATRTCYYCRAAQADQVDQVATIKLVEL